MNRGIRKVEEERNDHRSEVLEKVREERSRTQMRGWSFIGTGEPFLGLTRAGADYACMDAAG